MTSANDPLWRQLARKIEADIRSGRLAAGDPVPSMNELKAGSYDGTAHGHTVVVHVHQYLAMRGLTVRRPGLTTVVAEHLPDPVPDEVTPQDILELRRRIEDLERWQERHDQEGLSP